MELLLSEKDIQKVGLAGAGEGYQYLDLDMLIMRCVLDIQWKYQATDHESGVQRTCLC